MADQRIRDEREPGHFWADNEIVDTHLKSIGCYGFAVYMLLCRKVKGFAAQCDPSVGALAKELGISKPTIRAALKKLVDAGLIAIEQRLADSEDVGNDTNVYTLLKIKGGVVNEVDYPSKSGLLGVVNEVDSLKRNKKESRDTTNVVSTPQNAGDSNSAQIPLFDGSQADSPSPTPPQRPAPAPSAVKVTSDPADVIAALEKPKRERKPKPTKTGRTKVDLDSMLDSIIYELMLVRIGDKVAYDSSVGRALKMRQRLLEIDPMISAGRFDRYCKWLLKHIKYASDIKGADTFVSHFGDFNRATPPREFTEGQFWIDSEYERLGRAKYFRKVIKGEFYVASHPMDKWERDPDPIVD